MFHSSVAYFTLLL